MSGQIPNFTDKEINYLLTLASDNLKLILKTVDSQTHDLSLECGVKNKLVHELLMREE